MWHERLHAVLFSREKLEKYKHFAVASHLGAVLPVLWTTIVYFLHRQFPHILMYMYIYKYKTYIYIYIYIYICCCPFVYLFDTLFQTSPYGYVSISLRSIKSVNLFAKHYSKSKSVALCAEGIQSDGLPLQVYRSRLMPIDMIYHISD